MNPTRLSLFAAAFAGASYLGSLAWSAHQDLVTLHVRNLPLPEVVSKLRWQTWESFVVNKEVKGSITLDVHKMPLDQVLAIIGEQLSARWSTLYPIYTRKSSLINLERALRGEAKMADTRFTNYQGRAMGMRGGPDEEARPVEAVTLHLTNTDLTISALALERFGRAQVLVESGSNPKINLALAQISFDKAVKKVAGAAHLSSAKLYAIEPMRGFGNRDLAQRGNRPRPEQGRETNPEIQAQREERMQQVLQTLPEEERKRAEERQLERQAMQSLAPEQRQQVMTERMNSPEMQQRAEQRVASGIKNTTPEQRRERYERILQMRKARAAGAVRG